MTSSNASQNRVVPSRVKDSKEIIPNKNIRFFFPLLEHFRRELEMTQDQVYSSFECLFDPFLSSSFSQELENSTKRSFELFTEIPNHVFQFSSFSLSLPDI